MEPGDDAYLDAVVKETLRLRPAWIPFGGGTRRCLGAGFATLEMKEVLRAVVRRTRLSPASPRSERVRRRAVTLAPAGDALAIMSERR